MIYDVNSVAFRLFLGSGGGHGAGPAAKYALSQSLLL